MDKYMYNLYIYIRLILPYMRTGVERFFEVGS